MTHPTMAQLVELDVVPLSSLLLHVFVNIFSSATLLHAMHKQIIVRCAVSHRLELDVNQDLLHRYDDLRNYSNERSLYLAQLRRSIEEPWQQWESSHFDIESYKSKTVEQVL